MQQQEQLINNLIEQQQTSAYQQQVNLEITDNQLAVARVVNAKYKIYVIILLIAGVLLGTKFLPQAWQSYQFMESALLEYQNKGEDLNTKIIALGEQKKQRFLAEKIKKQIISCFNEQEGCSQLPEPVQKNLTGIVAYVQLGSLSSAKMGIDEKKILKNLDQYLIRNNPSEAVSSKNGDIEAIAIGKNEVIDKDTGFSKLPITVKIVFSSKDDLVSFVDNIEKFVILVEEDRILYKISQVNYDMMAYDESQETELLLEAYYFN